METDTRVAQLIIESFDESDPLRRKKAKRKTKASKKAKRRKLK